jgi:predicted HicB family RNase H-like nuclease
MATQHDKPIHLNIPLPPKVHTAIKMKAASVRKTVKDWATQILSEAAK